MNSPKVVNPELSTDEVRRIAETIASPALSTEGLDLRRILDGPLADEDGRKLGPKIVYRPNSQPLSEEALRRVAGATEAKESKKVNVEPSAEGAVDYVTRIGSLNVANRKLAVETMTKDDFTLAA